MYLVNVFRNYIQACEELGKDADVELFEKHSKNGFITNEETFCNISKLLEVKRETKKDKKRKMEWSTSSSFMP